ncbi:MAG: hypothetical protein QXG52_06155 [Candidatus Caldarchaeum sp.]
MANKPSPSLGNKDQGIVNYVLAEIPYIRPVIIYEKAINYYRWGVGFATPVGIFATTIDSSYNIKHVDSDVLVPVVGNRFYRSRICLRPASTSYDGAVVSVDGAVENELPREAAAMISQVVSLYSTLTFADDDNVAPVITRAVSEALSAAVVLKTIVDIIPPDADCDNETISKVVSHASSIIRKQYDCDFMRQFEYKYNISLIDYDRIEKNAAIFLEHFCWGRRVNARKFIRHYTLAVKFL